jgi:ornithine decarboxylase
MQGLREMLTYNTPLDLVRERSPERPVALVRPGAVAAAAQWFRKNFVGDVLFAVKANPSPWAIAEVAKAGVAGFDVASVAEIELVSACAPGAHMAFMHPVKSRAAIAAAYFEHGVRTFSLDSHEELAKILAATENAADLNLIVRLAVNAPGAAYTLNDKFGVSAAAAPGLLMAARRATQDLMGVSFHVGSQCLQPAAYPAAMAQASRALVRAGVFADIVDVGGGFPSIYPGMVPPDLTEYLDGIHRAFAEMMVHETTELWCEPGRALVAESTSLLTRVELRKDDALYLNDGAYGSLFDAAHAKWPFPVRMIRDAAVSARPLKPFQFYGPTCDSADHMPGPFPLPEDISEGDHIEIGMMGAYGVAMATRFNGFGELETVEVRDPPMASMYGLGPRPAPTPRRNDPAVIKLTRARVKKRRRR